MIATLDENGSMAGSRFELEKRVRDLEAISRGAWASVHERDVEVEALSRREEEYGREIESLRTKIMSLDGVRELALGAQSEIEGLRAELRHWRKRAEDAEEKRGQVTIDLDESLKRRAELEETNSSLSSRIQVLSRSRDEADDATSRISRLLEAERGSNAKVRDALATAQNELEQARGENSDLRDALQESRRVEARLRNSLGGSSSSRRRSAGLEEEGDSPQVAQGAGGREASRLRADVRRLLQLLATTSEFAGFADDCDNNMSFVGHPAARRELRRRQSDDELCAWAPVDVVSAAENLLPKDVAKRFLRETNHVWARAYRQKTRDLKADFQRRIDDIFRKTQHGLPYDKVRNQQQVDCLKQQIKQVRTKHHLKGRPKKTVSRHLPVQKQRATIVQTGDAATPAPKKKSQPALPSGTATTTTTVGENPPASKPVRLQDLEVDDDPFLDEADLNESFFNRVDLSPTSFVSRNVN